MLNKGRCVETFRKSPNKVQDLIFSIERGLLAFAKNIDRKGNDVDRIRSLQPIVQETADALSVALAKHEGLWPSLDRAVEQYRAIIANDVDSIDFGRLFGLGVILNNAVQAAKESIDRSNVYPLPPDCRILAESLLEMHGPLMLGSKDGQGLVADAERFSTDAQKRVLLDQSELALGRAIANPSAPVAQQVKDHIADLLSYENDTARKDHQSAYRGGLVKNAAIVFAGAAALSVVAAATTSTLPATLAALSMAVFGNKALQASKAGKKITDQLSSLIDKVTVDFVNDNEPLFREFAKQRRLHWLDRILDWSLSHRPLEEEGRSAASETTKYSAGSLEILILEPDVEVSEELKRALRASGFVADFAARSRHAALTWVATRPPNLIISETRLSGGESGIEAAVELANRYRCPIIFITNHPDDLSGTEQSYAFAIVPKPVDTNQLIRRINEFFENDLRT